MTETNEKKIRCAWWGCLGMNIGEHEPADGLVDCTLWLMVLHFVGILASFVFGIAFAIYFIIEKMWWYLFIPAGCFIIMAALISMAWRRYKYNNSQDKIIKLEEGDGKNLKDPVH